MKAEGNGENGVGESGKEKLLRRNMRSALQQKNEMEAQRQKQNRSKSLEPRAASEIRGMEQHRQEMKMFISINV